MKDDRVYLQHIRDCSARIRAYTRAGEGAFLAQTLVQDAVLRNLEVIGEAVQQLTDATRTAAPEIPWKQVAGMRDILIHHYFGVKLDRIWQVIERDLAPLEQAIERLLASGQDQ